MPSPAPLSLVRVPFRGGHLQAAQLDGEVWVPIRPVCDALGLAWQPQLKKLRAKPWANTCDTFMVSEGDDQRRRFSCVDLRSLPLWLATIEPSRVKAEAREALVAYQREAAEVLFRHFLAPSPSRVAGTSEGATLAALSVVAQQTDQNASDLEQLRDRVAQLEARRPPKASGEANVIEALAEALWAAIEKRASVG